VGCGGLFGGRGEGGGVLDDLTYPGGTGASFEIEALCLSCRVRAHGPALDSSAHERLRDQLFGLAWGQRFVQPLPCCRRAGDVVRSGSDEVVQNVGHLSGPAPIPAPQPQHQRHNQHQYDDQDLHGLLQPHRETGIRYADHSSGSHKDRSAGTGRRRVLQAAPAHRASPTPANTIDSAGSCGVSTSYSGCQRPAGTIPGSTRSVPANNAANCSAFRRCRGVLVAS
jgi:hypothetical protein